MTTEHGNKVLYITDTASDAKSGAGCNCRMHRLALEKTGLNIHSVFLQETSSRSEEHTDCYLDEQSFFCKLINIFLGYPSYLTKEKRRGIFNRIEIYRPNIIYFDMSVCGKLQKEIKRRYPECKVVTFFHDIEQDLLSEEIKKLKKTNLLRKKSLKVQVENEIEAVESADKTIVLNRRDYRRYIELYGKKPTTILPAINQTHDIENCQKNMSDGKLNILFVGGYYTPNVDGIRWFCLNVAPKIDIPYRLYIVGKGMERLKDELTTEFVSVIGTVDDLTPYYLQSDVVIGPIFSGGGMKTKTGEAFSYGKKYIGTSESLVGYLDLAPESFIGKYIYKCENEEEFLEAVKKVALMIDSTEKEIINWFDLNYSIEAATNIYLSVM